MVLWQLLSVVIILSIRVAYSHRAVPWHGYYVAESQRSDMMQLEEGEDYLLVADFAEGYGYEYINVRDIMHHHIIHHTWSKRVL